VRRDLLRWGAQQVIGAVLAILIVALQIYYGLIPSSLSVAAIKSLAWPYLFVIAVLILIAMAKAPVQLDELRRSDIASMQTDRRVLADEIGALQKQLQTPKRSAADEESFQKLRSVIAELGEPCLLALKHLRNHEQIIFRGSHAAGAWNSLATQPPDGLQNINLLKQTLGQLLRHGILRDIPSTLSDGISTQNVIELGPGFKRVIDDALYASNSASSRG
jgi:hypothetical protein